METSPLREDDVALTGRVDGTMTRLSRYSVREPTRTFAIVLKIRVDTAGPLLNDWESDSHDFEQKRAQLGENFWDHVGGR